MSRIAKPKSPHRVAIAAPPGAQTLDVVGPLDVFQEATRQSGGSASYEVRLVSVTDDPLLRTDGLTLVPDLSIFDADERIDTFLVAGTPHVTDLSAYGQFYAWLQRRAHEFQRFGSVCTGAFFLAEAGLLKGRRVTTHWEDVHNLSNRYPDLHVEPDRIFIRDGNLYTSAGVTAGIDLALKLVEEDNGRELALAVARRLVVFLKRPGGQSQFSQHLMVQHTTKSRVETIQHWVLDNLGTSLSIPKIASQAGMSERNFARVFRSETGSSPAEFIEEARVEEARRFLEEGTFSLNKIAVKCGFGTITTMRRAFHRRLGATPNEYRSRFHL